MAQSITVVGLDRERVVVIAPALTPVRPGDRVKTDRRDAEKLARLYRAGELTPIRVPTPSEEAARDLVRLREDILIDRLRARHRLGKFLPRHGRLYRETKAWGVRHRQCLYAQHFDLVPLEQTCTACLRALEDSEARLATVTQQIDDLAQTAPYRPLVLIPEARPRHGAPSKALCGARRVSRDDPRL